VVDKVALGQVFSEYFDFPCQFSFHRLLHTHNLSSGAGTIGQILADVPSGFSLTPPQETKKKKKLSTTPWRRMREWRYSSTILDLGSRQRWVVSFTPLPLYPRDPLYRRLGGPPEPVWTSWKREKSLDPPGIEPWPCSPIAHRSTDRAILASFLRTECRK
jgi:hypothetical protein